MGSSRKEEKPYRKKKLWGLRKEFLRERYERVIVKPGSTNPRDDVKDAIRKFRTLPDASRVASEFHLHFPKHPINRRAEQPNEIPGIQVGDIFRSRAELSLVKLHSPIQAGISRMNLPRADGTISTVAISVVSSGRYEDDNDDGEIIHYTGEGGNDLGHTYRQREDQHWTENNRALANNIQTQALVRVIRKRSDDTYSYDGLYKVVGFIKERGISNFMVIKFQLNRLRNQKELVFDHR